MKTSDKFKVVVGLFTLMMVAMMVTLIRVQPKSAWVVGIVFGAMGVWKFVELMFHWLTTPAELPKQTKKTVVQTTVK